MSDSGIIFLFPLALGIIGALLFGFGLNVGGASNQSEVTLGITLIIVALVIAVIIGVFDRGN
jgi:hypothetical protein